MHFLIRAIGANPPKWVHDGFQHYQSMLRPPFKLDITCHKPSKDHRKIEATLEESKRLLENLPPQALTLCLDPQGQSWDTMGLAKKVQTWQMDHRTIVLLIGGAHGHHPMLRQTADTIWSLSPLTLPHMLVRLILAEHIYRLSSIYHGHPYHK